MKASHGASTNEGCLETHRGNRAGGYVFDPSGLFVPLTVSEENLGLLGLLELLGLIGLLGLRPWSPLEP